METSMHLRNTVESVYYTATKFDAKSGKRIPSLKSTMLHQLYDNFQQCSDQFPNDELMQIIFFVMPALNPILRSPRENMRHKTEMVVQTRCMLRTRREISWLSNRPGRTIREKIASSPHLLAEKNTYSTDTLENRTVAFLMRRLYSALQKRIISAESTAESSIMIEKLREFYNLYRVFRHSQLWEIPAEYPMRMNNVLISDKNYSKVRKAAMMLRQYEQREEWSSEKQTALFMTCAAQLAASHLLQYNEIHLLDGYTMWDLNDHDVFSTKFLAYGNDGKECCLRISLEFDSVVCTVVPMLPQSFTDRYSLLFRESVDVGDHRKKHISFCSVNEIERVENTYFSGTSTILKIAEYIRKACIELLGLDDNQFTVKATQLNEINNQLTVQSSQTIVLDFCTLYFRKNHKMLCDCAYTDSCCEETQFFIPEEHYIFGALDYPQTKLYDLFTDDTTSQESINLLLKQYTDVIGTGNMLAYLVADNVNSFEQKNLRKYIAGYFYKHNLPVWRSVAAAEGLRKTGLYKFNQGIDYLIIDTDVPGCPITRLRVRKDGTFEHFISTDALNDNSILSENLFAASYLERYLSYYGLNSWFTAEERSLMLHTGIINQVLREKQNSRKETGAVLYLHTKRSPIYLKLIQNKQILDIICSQVKHDIDVQLLAVVKKMTNPSIKTKVIYICSRPAVQQILMNLDKGFTLREPDLMLFGAKELCNNYCNGNPTWHEHLPHLSLMVPKDGRYQLLNIIGSQASVNAAVSGQIIRVKDKLQLPPGSNYYEFPLITEVLGKKIQLVGRLTSSAFPLREMVTAEMEICYNYGSEDTYELLLHPIGQNKPFRELKVEWIIPKYNRKENAEIQLPKMQTQTIAQIKPLFEKASIFIDLNIQMLQSGSSNFTAEKLAMSTHHMKDNLWQLIQIYALSSDQTERDRAEQMMDQAWEKLDSCYADILTYGKHFFPDDALVYHPDNIVDKTQQRFWKTIRTDCEYTLAIFAGIYEESCGTEYFLKKDLSRISNPYILSMLYLYCLTFSTDDELWEHFMNCFSHINSDKQKSVMRTMSVMFWRNPNTASRILTNYPDILNSISKQLIRILDHKNVQKELEKEINVRYLRELRDMMELLLALLRLRSSGFEHFVTGGEEAQKMARNIKMIDMCLAEKGMVSIIEGEPKQTKPQDLCQYFNQIQRIKLQTDAPYVLRNMTKLCYTLVVYLTGDYGADSISITNIDFSEA